jgi:hypothetical protein
MKNDIFNEIINLADFLDSAGLHSFADEIDELAKKYQEKEPNPHFEKVFIDLRNEFQKAVSDPNKPLINAKSLPEILGVLDYVQKSIYSIPKQNYFIPQGTKAVFIPKEFYELSGIIAELMNAIKDINSEIQKEQDPKKKVYLELELRNNSDDLKEKTKALEAAKSKDPQAYEIAKKYINLIVNKTGEPFSVYPERRGR